MKVSTRQIAEGPNKGKWTFDLDGDASGKTFPSEAALARYLERKTREARQAKAKENEFPPN